MREGATGTLEEEGKQVMGLSYPLPPQPGSLGMPNHHSLQAAEKL